MGIDPIAEEYMSISTYQFAHNNPVWKIELEGLEGKETQGKDLMNHEPIKVKGGPQSAYIVAAKVVQETTKEVVKDAVEVGKSGLKTAVRGVGVALALLTDYMSPNYGGKTNEGDWPSVKGNFKVDEKLSVKDHKVGEKTVEETGIKRLNNTIDELIDSSIPGKDTKGRSTQYEREGGMDAANKEFDSLKPENVKEIEGGRVGTLADGRTVIVRGGSTDGRPTLEIQKGKNKTKFRYNE